MSKIVNYIENLYSRMEINSHKHLLKVILLNLLLKHIIFVVGRAYATSSHQIPQGRNTARVNGCSGVI